jgi:hypothetical protein
LPSFSACIANFATTDIPAFQYCIYREIRGSGGDDSDDDDDDDDGNRGDADEVKEYAALVGQSVSERMLLFRS